MPLDIPAFVRKWNASILTERSAYQQHFRDLCEALGVPHPTEEDDTGNSYTFEKHIPKTGGGKGFADVWKRGYFAWEYKSKGGDLNAALKQVNEYHAALENPPLLVVCDFVRFEVHTRFENTPPRAYKFTLDDLLHGRDTATSALPPLEVLRHVFGDYNQLRPNVTSARVTEAAASDFLRLAKELELERTVARDRPSKEQIAHFLMRLVFCLFADSVGLLPNHTFRALITNDRFSPLSFNRKLPVLFAAMSQEHGFFGAENIPYFNGGLFTDNTTIELNHADLGILYSASQHDWSHIEPSIFGTLFERSLDTAKRSMIGAHYTSPEDILLLIEPVVMQPLLRRWELMKSSILAALSEEEASSNGSKLALRLRAERPALNLLRDWAAELSSVRILDPACGSGNFLYMALKRLLDLWHEARVFGINHGLTITLDPIPNPSQLFGIEIDFYAHEIASIVVWIGFLQWKHDHGVKDDKEPLLRKLDNIQHDDAIMRYDANGKPYEPVWPSVEYIISNPPFLGDKKMRAELNTPEHPNYVDDLRKLYDGAVPGGADLVTYWFEMARRSMWAIGTRVGLLATNSISMVGNRPVLERIKSHGNIFMAWSDRPWMLAGAAVRISMVGFDQGAEKEISLDGRPVDVIHTDLTAESNVADAKQLEENKGICFLGVMKSGPFDIDAEDARKMLSAPLNPNARPNSDVVKRRIGGQDITGRDRQGWLIDFGVNMSEEEAALYQWPFEYVKTNVKPLRDLVRRQRTKDRWWIHGEARPGLRRAIADLKRYIVTPEVSKHRIFAFVDYSIVPDHKLHVFAREDNYFFGVLQSSPHEQWTLATCSWIGKGNDPSYNSETTFETFPFPWPPGKEPSEVESPLVKAIADAARELVRLRDAWLNPEKPAAVEPNQWEADLKKRTLTNLYNERPTWLSNAHRTLDEAVFAAYGWPSGLATQEILARLLTLNHERAATSL
jgi:type II restriction/modification system DNA methylase subunit YeeA